MHFLLNTTSPSLLKHHLSVWNTCIRESRESRDISAHNTCLRLFVHTAQSGAGQEDGVMEKIHLDYLHLVFWVLVVITFMFLMNHQVISQECWDILTFEDKLSNRLKMNNVMKFNDFRWRRIWKWGEMQWTRLRQPTPPPGRDSSSVNRT